jgi:hypothetical protein
VDVGVGGWVIDAGALSWVLWWWGGLVNGWATTILCKIMISIYCHFLQQFVILENGIFNI